MVKSCAIFNKAQGSRLDLPRFGGRFCKEENNYVNVIIIWSKFRSINDFILRNWGHVLTPFLVWVKMVEMD